MTTTGNQSGYRQSATRPMALARQHLPFLLAGLCASGLARAQPSGDAPAPPLELLAAFTEDSNVARSSAELAKSRGIVAQDEIYSPAARVNLDRNYGSGNLYVRGSLGYDFYQVNSVLNRERIDLSAGADRQFGECDVGGSGSFNRMQSGLEHLTGPVVDNTQTNSSASLTTRCDPSDRLAGTVVLSRAWSDNSAMSLETSNYQTDSVSLDIAYKHTSLGNVSLLGQFASTRFPDRLLSVSSGSAPDGYTLYSGGMRIDRELGQTLNASVSVSGVTLHPRVSGDSAYDGVAYDADVVFWPHSRLTGEISLARLINTSDRLDTTYSIDKVYRIGASYRVGPRLSMILGGQITEQHFFGTAIDSETDLTNQTTRSADGSLRYLVGRTFSIALTGIWEHRSASISAYSYTDGRVVLSLSRGF